jgi:hypothetical protein
VLVGGIQHKATSEEVERQQKELISDRKGCPEGFIYRKDKTLEERFILQGFFNRENWIARLSPSL